MSYVDIAVIALLVLFAGFGILTGVKKSALSLGAFLIAFLIAFFLAKPVAEGFLNIDGVRNFVVGTNGWSLYTWLSGYSSSFGGGSDFVNTNFYQPVVNIISGFQGYNDSFTLAQGQALYYAFLIFSAIIGVALYIVARILLCIATMIIKSFIGKRKSVASRLFGFLVGAVRGGLWAVVFTLVFSMIGGFTFIPFIDSAQAEYERAVIANYVNDAAYTLRNKVYLPNADMFARIVDKAEVIVKEEDKEQEGYVLLGQEADLYVYFLNLNYKSDPYSVVDGEIVLDSEKALDVINVSHYEHTNFGNVLQAIIDYNAAAAESIKEGGLANTSTSQLNTYITIVHQNNRAITDIMTDTINELYNYENYIAENSALTTEDAVTSANRELETKYTNLCALFDELKNMYTGIPTFGTLNMGNYPSVVKVAIKQ